MSDWPAGAAGDLPPVAAERVARQARSQVAGSLLTAAGAASLRSAGLEAAGEVMGCIVMHFGWSGWGCGLSWGYGSYSSAASTPVVLPHGDRYSSSTGFGPYVAARNHAYSAALGRLLAEATALGADGVVGVRLTWTHLDSGAQELMALGTAVRFTAPSGPGGRPWRSLLRQPFVTELTAENVATAVLSGWLPLALVFGLSAGIKHRDWAMQQQSGYWAGNTEVQGLTELAHQVRADARNRLTQQASSVSARGQVVISAHELRLSSRACRSVQDAEDYVGEARFVGTVLAHLGGPQRGRPSSLSILPLRRGVSR